MNSGKTGLLELEVDTTENDSRPLDDLLADHIRSGTKSDRRSAPLGRFAPIVGKLTGFADRGAPLVNFADNPTGKPVPARHVCMVASADVGREVVLVFENNDSRKPIIMGLLQPSDATARNNADRASVNATVDGEQIALTGKNEIVLRCGKASITMTRAGKIIIRGAYVLTRSSGVNRIKGGSVQIN